MAPTAVAPAYTAPAYGYCEPAPARGYGDFVLIVVLFILLIIVGASFVPKC
ncbi:MAG: YjcZ family sporulation protein [Bacillota bacterium]